MRILLFGHQAQPCETCFRRACIFQASSPNLHKKTRYAFDGSYGSLSNSACAFIVVVTVNRQDPNIDSKVL